MNVSYSFKIAECLIIGRSSTIFKNLNQQQRRISLLALQNLTVNHLPNDPTLLNVKELDEFVVTLRNIGKKESKQLPWYHFLVRITKACLNIFGLRISSRHLESALSQYIQERKNILALINSTPDVNRMIQTKIKDIKEMEEAIDYIQGSLIPLTHKVDEILKQTQKLSFQASQKFLVREIEKLQNHEVFSKAEQELGEYVKMLNALNKCTSSQEYFKEIKLNYRVNQTRLKQYEDNISTHIKKVIPREYKKVKMINLLNEMIVKKND